MDFYDNDLINSNGFPDLNRYHNDIESADEKHLSHGESDKNLDFLPKELNESYIDSTIGDSNYVSETSVILTEGSVEKDEDSLEYQLDDANINSIVMDSMVIDTPVYDNNEICDNDINTLLKHHDCDNVTEDLNCESNINLIKFNDLVDVELTETNFQKDLNSQIITQSNINDEADSIDETFVNNDNDDDEVDQFVDCEDSGFNENDIKSDEQSPMTDETRGIEIAENLTDGIIDGEHEKPIDKTCAVDTNDIHSLACNDESSIDEQACANGQTNGMTHQVDRDLANDISFPINSDKNCDSSFELMDLNQHDFDTTDWLYGDPAGAIDDKFDLDSVFSFKKMNLCNGSVGNNLALTFQLTSHTLPIPVDSFRNCSPIRFANPNIVCSTPCAKKPFNQFNNSCNVGDSFNPSLDSSSDLDSTITNKLNQSITNNHCRSSMRRFNNSFGEGDKFIPPLDPSDNLDLNVPNKLNQTIVVSPRRSSNIMHQSNNSGEEGDLLDSQINSPDNFDSGVTNKLNQTIVVSPRRSSSLLRLKQPMRPIAPRPTELNQTLTNPPEPVQKPKITPQPIPVMPERIENSVKPANKFMARSTLSLAQQPKKATNMLKAPSVSRVNLSKNEQPDKSKSLLQRPSGMAKLKIGISAPKPIVTAANGVQVRSGPKVDPTRRHTIIETSGAVVDNTASSRPVSMIKLDEFKPPQSLNIAAAKMRIPLRASIASIPVATNRSDQSMSKLPKSRLKLPTNLTNKPAPAPISVPIAPIPSQNAPVIAPIVSVDQSNPLNRTFDREDFNNLKRSFTISNNNDTDASIASDTLSSASSNETIHISSAESEHNNNGGGNSLSHRSLLSPPASLGTSGIYQLALKEEQNLKRHVNTALFGVSSNPQRSIRMPSQLRPPRTGIASLAKK